jgi:hypothetical protein
MKIVRVVVRCMCLVVIAMSLAEARPMYAGEIDGCAYDCSSFNTGACISDTSMEECEAVGQAACQGYLEDIDPDCSRFCEATEHCSDVICQPGYIRLDCSYAPKIENFRG